MAEFIEKTDTLNEGREKLNASIKDANSAKTTARQAVDTSNHAKQIAQAAEDKSDNTQTQLDTIVIEGDSSVEAAQARVDEKGVAHPTLKKRINDGFTEVNEQMVEIPQVGVSVLSFGAVGNRTNDDRQAIQNAIDYLESLGGGTLFFPYSSDGFSIKSTHPDFLNAGLVIKSNNIKFETINHTRVYADVEMEHLIYFPKVGFSLHSFSMNNIRLEGNQLCDIGIFSEDFIYRTSFIESYVHNFKDKGIKANVFTAKFDRCIFRQNKNVGIELNSLDMPGTSVVFIDTNCSENETGYKLTYVNYTSFISSFGEYSNLVFDLESCNTVSLTGCGAEHIKQVMRVKRCSGVEVGSFYLGEVGFNGEPANEYIFDFENSNSGHFGGVNRQETLQAGSKMVRFTDCTNMSMKYGRIARRRNQVDFIRSQVTVLDDIKRTTTSLTYYIDPNNGSDYADYDNHGTQPDKAFRSWWKVAESLPKNIDHNVSVTIMGDIDEVMDLKGIVVSSSMQISGNGFNINKLDIRGCLGNILIDNCKFTEDSSVHNSQGIRMTNSTYKVLEARYSSGLYMQNNTIIERIWARSSSTIQSLNNTGTGYLHADASIVFSFGTEPTGTHRELQGGRIFRQT